MITPFISYMGTWPMWLQAIIILGVFGIIVGLFGAMIYKIIKADKIKAGLSGVEIDEHDETASTDKETIKETQK